MSNIENLLEQAVDYINQEEFTQAHALLTSVLDENQENLELLKNIGLCEINLDNPIGAIDVFSKVIELEKDDATSYYYLASCYNRTGEKEKAVDNFNKVIELRPNFLDAYKNLAMIHIEFQQLDNAIELINGVISNDEIEKDYSCYYILATAFMLKKDYRQACSNLELALELNDNHLSIINSLSVCYMNLEEHAKALEILEKAKGIDETNPLTFYNIGVCYQALENYTEALKHFQISYGLEPSVSMLSSMADCAAKAKEWELAKTLYTNLIDTFPNNLAFRLALCEIHILLEEYEDALINANFLVLADEKNAEFIKKKGTLERKTKRYEDSIETFNVLIKKGKIDVEVYYNLAFNYVELGDFDNAKEMFKKCIILEPNNPYAHKDLGVLYLKMNCYEWALEEMQEAINLEDDVAEFHYSLGVCNMMLDRVEVAKNNFQTTIQLDNTYVDAYAYLGYAFLLDRDFEKALPLLQAAIKIDPNNFLAKTYLAKYYFMVENFNIAKELLLDLTNSTKDDETMNMLAISYMNLEEYENAMGIFYGLSKNYPKNHILLTNLAKMEAKCNKQKEAIEHIRQVLMIYDDYQPALDLLKELTK